MRSLAWTAEAWEDYLFGQSRDQKTLERINALIADILRDGPFEGIDKPEPVKHALVGAWSGCVDGTYCLVYWVNDRCGVILQARYHY